MKIDLNAIDATQFMTHTHVVNGEALILVQPQHIGAKWTQANKIFRSSLWNYDGELVSAAFPKFMNWGENPDNFPVPTSLKDTVITEKVDGSLLIVSKYKGHTILRTRGTSDATVLDNGHELTLFLERYGKRVEYLLTDYPAGSSHSLLFEWVSPLQKIILNYGDNPEWFLVGVVNHNDYSLMTQERLNYMADEYGFKRPVTYTFVDINTLLSDVEQWKGKEGVVVYSNNGQTLHKVKAASYLFLHRMKEELGSIDKVIDVWFSRGRPSYQEFEQYITNTFDWELWKMIMPESSKICDAWKHVEKILFGFDVFVRDVLKPLPTRREQAEKVLASYGQTNRAAFVFSRLDNKILTDDQLKKLLYQCLKTQS